MSSRKIICHKCKHSWEFEPPMGRRDECPSCGLDSRVCLNCRFYDRSAYHECREEQAEWVKEKNSGNFCGFFDATSSERGVDPSTLSALSKLDQLFGNSSSSCDSDETAKPASKPSVNLQDELAKFLNSKK